MTLKYTSKLQRMLATIDAYRDLVGKRPITMEEVSEWMIANRLAGPPKHGASLEACEAWERRLEEAIAAWPRGQSAELSAVAAAAAKTVEDV